jgi:meso-butanediol dehydrogenase/(S,S)-butanediol dehydrogenase/diacetyl reductase
VIVSQPRGGSEQRVALITGGGRGIGRSIAERLSIDGFAVVIADLDGAMAITTAASIGGRAVGVDCDVTDRAAVAAAVSGALDEFGRVDVLVHNVGVSRECGFDTMTDEDWAFQVDGTLTSAFMLAQQALPVLERQGGSIVFIGSVNGLTAFGHEAYSAAKAGLVSLAQNLTVRYGPRGIRTNVIAPATIRTEAWNARLAQDPTALGRLARHYPLGRVGTPGDVAGAVSFLVSEDAAWVSGVVLPVDGGLLAGNLAFVRDRDLRPDVAT